MFSKVTITISGVQAEDGEKSLTGAYTVDGCTFDALRDKRTVLIEDFTMLLDDFLGKPDANS